MGIGKLFDNLLEKVSTDSTPLSHVDEQALEAELKARVKARGDNPTRPEANPRAKYAGASAAAAKYREAQAAKRAATMKSEQDRRRAAQKRAADEAFRRAQESARRQSRSSSASGSSGPRASAGNNQRRSTGRRRGQPDIAEHFKALNLPPTASLTEAKRAFRKLMRKYHPDLAPEGKKKAATELTMRITAAYTAIEAHFSGK